MNRRGLTQGALFFLAHFLVEVASFYVISHYVSGPLVWVLALAYDFFAFVPQGIFGWVRDVLWNKADFALPGAALLAASVVLQSRGVSPFAVILCVSIGNAMAHAHAAEETLRVSPGQMTPAALFVSGGSFGLITGRLLAQNGAPAWPVLLAALLLPAVSLFAKRFRCPDAETEAANLSAYRFLNPGVPVGAAAALAVLVVIVRAYMGYGIPTGWIRTTAQTVLLYSFMGAGKALGGILTDLIGIRKTALLSTLGALPFLLFGDRLMLVSLVGILLFSMTMAITLGLLVSALPAVPGFAFGLTTIGLALGTFPIFFYKISSFAVNCAVVSALTLASFAALAVVCVKTEKNQTGGKKTTCK